jgi:hypothetical protein
VLADEFRQRALTKLADYAADLPVEATIGNVVDDVHRAAIASASAPRSASSN